MRFSFSKFIHWITSHDLIILNHPSCNSVLLISIFIYPQIYNNQLFPLSTHWISQMNLALFSQSSATQKFWFRGSIARQWCVTGCPPAQLLNPRVPSLPQSHVPGVWKSVPDVQYFKCKSLSDPESGKKKEDIEPAFFLSPIRAARGKFLYFLVGNSSYHSSFFLSITLFFLFTKYIF